MIRVAGVVVVDEGVVAGAVVGLVVVAVGVVVVVPGVVVGNADLVVVDKRR